MGNISKQTFEYMVKQMAMYIATANQYYGGIDSHTQPAGVVQGIQLTLYTIYGYETKDDKDGGYKEVSVALRVKESALELVDKWKKTDDQLNGEYTLGGVKTIVSSPYNGADYRFVAIGENDRKNVPNSDVLSMILNGLLVKKEEPVVEYMETDDEVSLDAMVNELEEFANA